MITINTEIPRELKQAIKILAAKKNTTFKAIVIEALQEKLEKEAKVVSGVCQLPKAKAMGLNSDIQRKS